jgi:nucleoside-diphosphate-sugar epimerase
LGLPYTKRDFAQYPPMMKLFVEAARSANVKKLVLISNVYPYGLPQTERVAETHPRNPASVKGEFRKQQEDILLAAHDPKGLLTLSLRLPNFYGPGAVLSIAHGIFSAAVKGAPAQLLGPIDTRQELCFTPDVGPLVADLLQSDSAFGQAYNFAGSGETTWRKFTEEIYSAAGHSKPKLRVAGPGLVRFLGLFSTLMRELVELRYLQTHPLILDDAKLHQVLPNVRKTPYREGIARTLATYRK